MKRIRLAALLAALLTGIAAGCSTFGDGPIMSRLRGNRAECACDAEMGGPCCEGALMGEGLAGGPALPAVASPAVPVLTPAPRDLVVPAQPLPAPPTSFTRSK